MTNDHRAALDGVDRRLSLDAAQSESTDAWRFMLILPSGFAVDYKAESFDAALDRGRRRCWYCDWYIEHRQLLDGVPVSEWESCTPILRNVIVEARDDAPSIVRSRDDAQLRVFEPDAGSRNGRGRH
jgi:hypothetical protein